jgi:hypothetical protein
MNNVSEILKQHAIWLETNDLGDENVHNTKINRQQAV